MKSLRSIAFAIVLGVFSIPALSVVAPVTMTEAQACDVQMGRRNSCHSGYLDSCRQYGYVGPCGLGGQRAGSGGGHYARRPMQQPMYHQPVYRRPMMAQRPQAVHYRYHKEYSHRHESRSAPVPQGPRQSTAQGAARIPMSDLKVSSLPCRLSSGDMGIVVKVISTGETRCGRG